MKFPTSAGGFGIGTLTLFVFPGSTFGVAIVARGAPTIGTPAAEHQLMTNLQSGVIVTFVVFFNTNACFCPVNPPLRLSQTSLTSTAHTLSTILDEGADGRTGAYFGSSSRNSSKVSYPSASLEFTTTNPIFPNLSRAFFSDVISRFLGRVPAV